MLKLKKKELIAFVENLISQGYPTFNAIKTSSISARKAQSTETIKTILRNGTKETQNTSQNGEWIITNPDGEKYITSNKIFKQKYHISDNKYQPNKDVQIFIRTNCDMIIEAPWGEEQFIAAEGVLNITNFDDIYGIAKDEFLSTYKEI